MESTKWLAARDAAVWAVLALTTSPALAQFDKSKAVLNTVQVGLLGLAVVLITIATMFVGFRMIFQAAQWKDVAPVFWGSVLISAAPAIAAMLVG